MRIAIVGGGAAGCIAGLDLLASRAADELEIDVFEMEPAAYTTLCGEGIRVATLERFTAFDSSPHVPERFRGAAWHFPGGVTVHVDDPCATLERATWIPAMAESLAKRGASYRTGEKVTPARVRELVAAHDLVIGADGPGSVVAKSIGAEHETMLGIQYRVERAEYTTDRLEFHTDKRFSPEYAWVFPKGDLLNVGLLAEGKDPWGKLDAYMAEQGVRGHVVKREAYPIGFHGRTFAQGNVALLGDAAGLTNPVTKGGLAAIIHASGVLRECVEDALDDEEDDRAAGAEAARRYQARIADHPLTSRSFAEALKVMRAWSNEDFEKLAKHAPPILTVGGAAKGSARRRYAWPLAKALAANPGKIRDVWVLADAMGLSREYSW